MIPRPGRTAVSALLASVISDPERYLRHLLLREVGGQGQRAIEGASVLVVGAGGLGCPILAYLVGAGIGRVRFCDPDIVSLSNLPRQTLYGTDDIGRPKVEVAAARLGDQNPDVVLEPVAVAFTDDTAPELTAGIDLIVEGVDRFAPRYALNRASVARGIPLVSAAIGRFDGHLAQFPGGTPCYACLVPDVGAEEASCETDGVVGPLPGVIGSLAALEVLKQICGLEGRLDGELLIFEGLRGTSRRVTIRQDRDCPVCGRLRPDA